ncbi:MAG TPA: type II secretion system F family protein [Candidatus Paceibacterota bacterium]|nr:type II secretion system F family protein [Candidatus Paceibacterota bacterium]HRZ34523.1 type II secretion system F family protein [Candidatus Paceibacterota bacterium]
MSSKFLSFQQNASQRDQINFARDLAILLRSGVTLNEAIRLLQSQAKSSAMKKLLSEAIENVSRGTTLSVTLQESSVRLRSVFISMVHAGEISGTLVSNLLFLADWLERNLQLKQEVKSVTLYPKIVFSAAILLGAGLAIFILPRLIPVFQGMKIALPLITRMVLATAVFVRSYSIWIILGILVFIVVFTALSRITLTRRWLQKFYLKIPFFGELIRAYELALYSQLMHVLLKSGLTINESFEIASTESSSVPYQDSFIIIKERLIKGVSLSDSIADFPKLYPPNFISIIAVGEKTGTIEGSFESLSAFYNREINTKTKNLPTILEPILLVGIGLVVGIVALSIILPIYTLSGSLR